MSVVTATSVPKYRQVYASLREYIEAGRWPEGSLIPTEIDIAKLFGVSRITVREALQILENENFISRQQGRGTIVKSTAPLPSNCFVSFTDQILREGHRLHTQILDVRIVTAKTAIELTGAPFNPDDDIVLVERLRIVDDAPRLIGRAFLPHRLVIGIGRHSFAETGPRQSMLFVLENTFGIRMTEAHEVVVPIALGGKEAALLGVAPETPALRQICQMYNAQQELVMSDEFITKDPIEFQMTPLARAGQK